MDYFEKLKQLPCEVVKESGRLTGNYALRISISGGIWFLEYVYDGELFSGYEEAVYPFRCSGNTTLSEKFFYSGGLCSVMFIVCAFIFEAIVKINEEDEEDKEDEE